MAQTYVQKGETLNYTNGSGATIASGAMVLVGSRLGVAVSDIADGATGVLVMAGVHALPKATGAITQGAKVYYDADGNRVGGPTGIGCLTATSDGNTLIGYAHAAAASGDLTVDVALNTMG
jgi:predicted RecA/RadA family phage recombinase